ncbi:MAG: integrin alpha, partial [Chloroflexi bacterium]|nr:integrin alpha [Chloroflexota bacterium]
FELAAATALRLTVDDRAATYPVIIDPLLTGTPAELQSDEANARLGFSVAGAGDVDGDGYGDVIVGAPYFDAGQINEGAAFLFLGSASGIADGSPATAAAQLESDLAFANLGESVAGAGDVNGDGFDDVIVGDPNYGNGAAFVFHGSASGVADGNPATAATRITADPTEMPTCPAGGNAGFGVSVAGAGDVNGDGFDDVIVGAPRYPPCSSVSGILGIGAAFVFSGSASGIADASSLTAATRIEGNEQQGWLGASVAGAGDVDGDGYGDVIVGAPLYSSLESDEGAAFMFLGGALGIASGTAATASAQLESNHALAHLGSSVAGAGDVDGDGYGDVIVGAPDYDASPSDSSEGAAFVFLGSASGVASANPGTAATRLVSDQAHSALGVSVAGVGDVDRDGYGDVLASASKYDVAAVEAGAA